MTARACPVVEDFDPLSEPFLADPSAVIEELRLGQTPIFYAPILDYYVVTRHEDLETVFRNHGTFSAAVVQQPLVEVDQAARRLLLVDGRPPRPSMASLDGDEHGRLRSPAARAFSARKVAAMEPGVRASVRHLLAAVVGRPRFRTHDLASDLLTIRDEHPDRLTLDEIASILFSLMFAG